MSDVAPEPVPVRSVLRDCGSMTHRHLLQWVRLPQGIAASLGQPVMFVLLFRYVFGGAIGVPGVDYVDYVIPGIALQVAVFGAAGTAIGLSEDLRSGLLDRFRSLPVDRGAMLVGRVVADAVRNLVAVGLTVGLGYVVGFRFHGGVVGALGMVGLAVVAGTAFSLLAAWIGLVVTGVEAVQAVVLIVLFALTFASSVFVPARTMPMPLRAFAEHQPVSVLADAMRDLALDPSAPGTLHDVVLGLGWSALLVAVFGPLAARAYGRVF